LCASGSVLKKLALFKEGLAEKDPSPRKLVVRYDVFLPSTNFRKSSPPPPQYQVIILRLENENIL